jgi:hypothetical protein
MCVMFTANRYSFSIDMFVDSTMERVKEISAHEYAVQCASTDTFYQRLRRNIKSLKMHIRRDVPSDGNCFFYCVSDQLGRLGLQPRNHTELRSDLVHSIQNLVRIS